MMMIAKPMNIIIALMKRGYIFLLIFLEEGVVVLNGKSLILIPVMSYKLLQEAGHMQNMKI